LREESIASGYFQSHIYIVYYIDLSVNKHDTSGTSNTRTPNSSRRGGKRLPESSFKQLNINYGKSPNRSNQNQTLPSTPETKINEEGEDSSSDNWLLSFRRELQSSMDGGKNRFLSLNEVKDVIAKCYESKVFLRR
jgi:hypothetical protein